MLLAARDLACERDDRLLFSGLDFQLAAREILQVEGRNGSGKTSLLRIICGLALASAGGIYWRNQPVERVRPDYLSQINYLGHHAGVKAELTPLENLRFAQALATPRGDVDLYGVLDRLSLRGFEDVPCRMLSAGQNRRVGLARLLVSDALLWVLDEPFTALDRRGIADVEAILLEHVRSGGIVVLTTHHTTRLDGCTVKVIDLSAGVSDS
ncbi:MAG: cytochrome c biogenesis heme-transporting ATPase CcmA [Gammaproteobacteria bacterium]|nr:cytochrome c biogenesis heme-transporting ATPase CcmA [Gammaproteobacteria bacterium]